MPLAQSPKKLDVTHVHEIKTKNTKPAFWTFKALAVLPSIAILCAARSLFLPWLETQNERKMREREGDNGGWLAPVMKQRFYHGDISD